MSESSQVIVKPESQPAPAQPVSEATQMLAVIERVAANPEADIDKLERLLDMQERIMNRNAEQAFNTAMAQMQAELPVVSKNGEIIVNKTVRSKFAKLDDIQEACKPFLKKYGFAVSFRIKNTERDVCISGILMHNQGHREETEITLPADGSGSKNNVQSIGSSVSYGKRYVYGALLDITIKGEDTDGVPPANINNVSPQQIQQLRNAMRVAGITEQQFCTSAGVATINQLHADRYNRAMNHLQNRAQGVQQ